MLAKIAIYCDARHVSKNYPGQDICPPVTRFERSRVQEELRKSMHRRHREFISIFNLIRNSFATISQTAPSPARAVPSSLPPPSPPTPFRRPLPRGRFVSRSFSATSYVSAISRGTSVALLPLYFPHGASLSLIPLPPDPSSILPQALYPRLSPYRCRFPVPFTRLISRYLLRLPSSMYNDTPSWVSSFHTPPRFTLICSAKFSEKTTMPSTEAQPAGDDYFTIDNRGIWSSTL